MEKNMPENIDGAILRLARWAAKNCPESLELESEQFLRFDERRKDVVWIDREQFKNMVELFDSLVFHRGNIMALSWVGEFKNLLRLYDLIYAGRINDDAPAGSP